MGDEDAPYELVLAPPARRALATGLPEAVATAAIDLLTVTLVSQPRRVGKPLRGELAGIYSARRGTYRVLYRILEDRREVVVLGIEHAAMSTGGVDYTLSATSDFGGTRRPVSG